MPHTLKSNTSSKRIPANEAWEVKYWAETLGCSEAELIPAVKAMFQKSLAGKSGNGNTGNNKMKSR